MISVITPSVRRAGLDLVEKSLKRQTYRDFEWLVGSPFLYLKAVWIEDDFKNGYWSLNRIYNKLIEATTCEHIVTWQDYTAADPTALEKFAYYAEHEPNTIVTAVGNKYTKVYPKLGEKVWQDPRERTDHGSYYPCYFNDIEFNLALFPKSAVYDVGGFMEDFDFQGYGMDAYGVLERINEIGGYDFKINQDIKSYSLEHSRTIDWDENNLLHNDKYAKLREKLREKGRWPKADYLTRP